MKEKRPRMAVFQVESFIPKSSSDPSRQSGVVSQTNAIGTHWNPLTQRKDLEGWHPWGVSDPATSDPHRSENWNQQKIIIKMICDYYHTKYLPPIIIWRYCNDSGMERVINITVKMSVNYDLKLFYNPYSHHSFCHWGLSLRIHRIKLSISPQKFEVDGGANRCQDILVCRYTCTPMVI